MKRRLPPPRVAGPALAPIPLPCDRRLGFGLFAAAMTEGSTPGPGPVCIDAADAPRGLHNLLRYFHEHGLTGAA